MDLSRLGEVCHAGVGAHQHIHGVESPIQKPENSWNIEEVIQPWPQNAFNSLIYRLTEVLSAEFSTLLVFKDQLI